MLNLLVKLANYFDDKNQHVLAEEFDGLINKISQDLVGKRGPLQREQKPQTLVEALTDVVNQAFDQINSPTTDAAQQANFMNQRIGNAMGSAELPEALKPYVNNVLANLNSIINNNDPASMRDAWENVVNNGRDAVMLMQNTAQNAMEQANKPKAKHKPNALIMQIQQNLGIEPSGTWTPETNNKFIALMKSQPAYASYMRGNTFKGNLQQAARFVMQLTEYNRQDKKPEAQQAPAQPGAQWHSKHFQLTPAAVRSLHEIEKYWPGTAQKELNDLDEYAEKGTMGKQVDQEMFEEMLAGRARPA